VLYHNLLLRKFTLKFTWILYTSTTKPLLTKDTIFLSYFCHPPRYYTILIYLCNIFLKFNFFISNLLFQGFSLKCIRFLYICVPWVDLHWLWALHRNRSPSLWVDRVYRPSTYVGDLQQWVTVNVWGTGVYYWWTMGEQWGYKPLLFVNVLQHWVTFTVGGPWVETILNWKI